MRSIGWGVKLDLHVDLVVAREGKGFGSYFFDIGGGDCGIGAAVALLPGWRHG